MGTNTNSLVWKGWLVLVLLKLPDQSICCPSTSFCSISISETNVRPHVGQLKLFSSLGHKPNDDPGSKSASEEQKKKRRFGNSAVKAQRSNLMKCLQTQRTKALLKKIIGKNSYQNLTFLMFNKLPNHRVYSPFHRRLYLLYVSEINSNTFILI